MIERPATYNRLLRAHITAIEHDRDLESAVRDRFGEQKGT